MQGMMIQDFSAVPQSNGGSVAAGTPEVPEQSFGTVLGTETGKPEVTVKDNLATVMPETSQGQTQDTTSFFMAALFNQSASYVKTSENTELIAAAERTQELIGHWLQPQQEADGGLEEIITVALEVLEQVAAPQQVAAAPQQVSAAPRQVAEAGTETLPPALSDAEVAELRELMAVMLQSGRTPEPLLGHPLVAELQKQLDLVQPRAAVKGGLGREFREIPQVATGISAASTAEADSENSPTGTNVQPVVVAGLQESQIAKILTPRQEQSAGKPQFELGKQGEVAPPVVVEGEIDSELSLETAKPLPLPVGGEIQGQQISQVSGVSQRQAAQMEILTPKLMQLPSGQQLAESQLVDQVVTHLAGSRDGETGRMSLRLNPAELGSVRLDLIIDGDRLRAHLQTQTQQVQEVLDRHLPQLREALQQQGLKIDEFRVDVQTSHDQASEQRFAWQQQNQQQHSPQSPWLNDDWQQAEIAIPLQQLMQQAGGSISLRV